MKRFDIPKIYIKQIDSKQLYKAVFSPDRAVYFSYNTPIALYFKGKWLVIDVKYSRTTTQHQNLVTRLESNAEFVGQKRFEFLLAHYIDENSL